MIEVRFGDDRIGTIARFAGNKASERWVAYSVCRAPGATLADEGLKGKFPTQVAAVRWLRETFETDRITKINPRIEAAVEAGAEAFHNGARDKGSMRWESASERWRAEMRELIRPVVVAAVRAYDEADPAKQ